MPDGRPVGVWVLEFDAPQAARDLAARVGAQGDAFQIEIDRDKVHGRVLGRFIVLAGERQVTTFSERIFSVAPAGGSLADNPGFQKAAAEFAPDAYAWAWGDLTRVLDLLDAAAGNDREYPPFRKTLGFAGARWAAANLTTDNGRIVLRARAEFDEGVLRGARLLPEAEPLKILTSVPGEAFGCAALTLNNPQALWEEFRAIVRDVAAELGQNQGGPPAQLAQFDAMLGLSRNDSAFAQLTGQVAVFLAEPGGPLTRQDWLAVLALKDPAKFNAGLPALESVATGGRGAQLKTVEGVLVREIQPGKLYVAVLDHSAVLSGSERALVWYAGWFKRRAQTQHFAARAKDVLPQGAAATLAIAVNAGTFLSFFPREMRDSGKLDSWIALDLARTEGRLDLRLASDSALWGQKLDPTAVSSQAGLVAALMLPAISKARTRARRTADLNNLRQIGLASMMFANDQGGRLPDRIDQLVPKYLADPRILVSPLDRQPQGIGPEGLRTSYVYLGGVQINGEGAAARIIVAYTRPGVIPGGRNCLYLDGHVRFVRAPAVPMALKRSFDELMKRRPDEQTAARWKAFYQVQ
jgi:prepilin-type processing-associated H-X9-DG protein